MRFTLIFALTTLFLVSGLYGLICAVDPYNKLGNNLFGLETKAVDFARENKFNQLEHTDNKYDAFIMGSSSAHRYMTKELNRLSGMTFYNYSTQSATPEDYIAMTRHILKRFKVKLLMISFDFEVLNKFTKTDDMFFSSPLSAYLKEVPPDTDTFNDAYFTLAALQDTFKVLWVNKFGKAEHAYLEHGDHVREKKPAALKIKQFSGGKYVFDQNRINYLKTIKELGDKHGFKVIAFTSPLTIDHLNKINANPELKKAHEEFKKTLADIFGELYDFHNEGIAQYSTIDYFNDSNHPNHDFSTIVLERIFGKADPSNPEFGRLLKK